MSKVREATIDDIEEILRMVLAFKEASPFKDFEVDEEYFRYFINSMISSPVSSVFILEEEKAIGMLAATINDNHPLMYQSKLAAELAWWVDPEHRGKSSLKLFNAFEKWAVDKNCSYVSVSSLDDRIGGLYESLGYTKTEVSYMRKI